MILAVFFVLDRGVKVLLIQQEVVLGIRQVELGALQARRVRARRDLLSDFLVATRKLMSFQLFMRHMFVSLRRVHLAGQVDRGRVAGEGGGALVLLFALGELGGKIEGVRVVLNFLYLLVSGGRGVSEIGLLKLVLVGVLPLHLGAVTALVLILAHGRLHARSRGALRKSRVRVLLRRLLRLLALLA